MTAPEHFDRLHGDLLLRAAAAAGRRQLRRGAAIDDAGRRLARACHVLLDDTIAEPLHDVVFRAQSHANSSRQGVAGIGKLTRSPDRRAGELQ